MKSRIGISVCLALSLMLSGCATYHLTTQSLLEQFADSGTEKKVNYIVAFPFVFPGVVKGNTLRELKVTDAAGKEQMLHVTTRMGIRITTKGGKRNTFYFDTLLIQDSTITGKKDHFFGFNVK